mgnify:CR=1 FL=1
MQGSTLSAEERRHRVLKYWEKKKYKHATLEVLARAAIYGSQIHRMQMR